jgi:hypothetical protein
MHKRFAYLSLLAVLVAAWFGLGCSAGSSHDLGFGGAGGAGSSTGSMVSGTGPGSGGGTTSTGSCMLNCNSTTTGGSGPLAITPTDVTIPVTVGAPVTPKAFHATMGGMDVSSQVTWSYEQPQIGVISNSGSFTPGGTVGGTGTLTATLDKQTATTSVSVTITETLNPAALTPAQQAAFNSPTGGPDSIQIVYPYDNTVFPLGVLAPDLQWNGSAMGDLYRLRITEKYYTYTAYITADPPSDNLMAQTDWDNLESSGSGAKSDPALVELDRMSGGKVYNPVTLLWHIAQGRLHGSVYYWELPDENNPNPCGVSQTAGRLLRIKPDSDMPDAFFQPGVCYGCHTVSRDGTNMAAVVNGTTAPFPIGTINLAANPITWGALGAGAGITGTFSAFNNKGDKLLYSNDAAQEDSTGDYSQLFLAIIDSGTGAVLNPNPFGMNCGEPAWSPDGTKIAGICNLAQNDGANGWVFDANFGNLTVADVAPDGVTISNVTDIVPSGSPGRPAYPSFSPDSTLITFGRPQALGSRSWGLSGPAPGNLWLVSPNGNNLVSLDTASTGLTTYNPVFAPLQAGGYYWIVFVSRRDYGNQLVGQQRNQLWITAIDDPPTPGTDPSHPAFYMRGQETCGDSENAYYALDPCAAVGASCVSGIDCCNGTCVVDPTTMMDVCGTPPPPGQCAQNGNACKVASDCCNAPSGVLCTNGFCQPPIPM